MVYIYFYQDPKCLNVRRLASSTEMDVVLCRPAGNPALSRYDVAVRGGSRAQGCTIVADIQPEQKCTISGLEPGVKYVVEARTCVADKVLKEICANWISYPEDVVIATTTTSEG